MTGVDNHLAGLGNMGELLSDNQRGQPGYEGHLNDRVISLAEALRMVVIAEGDAEQTAKADRILQETDPVELHVHAKTDSESPEINP